MTLALKPPGALHAMFNVGTEDVLSQARRRDNLDLVGDIEAALENAEVLDSRRRLDILLSKGNGVCLTALAVKRLRADDSYRTVPCCSGSDS